MAYLRKGRKVARKGVRTGGRRLQKAAGFATKLWANRHAIARGAVVAAKAGYTAYKAYKKQSIHQNIKPVGDGSTISFYRSGSKARGIRKVFGKLSAENIWATNSVGQFGTSNATGRQIMAVIPAIAGGFSGDLASIASVLRTEAGAGTYNYNTMKWLLKSCTTKLMISNAENQNVFLDVYHCTARDDEDQYSDPLAMVRSGLADEENAASTTDDIMLNVTPFNSKLFCSSWKINKVQHFEMGAGRTVIINGSYHFNKFLDGEKIKQDYFLRNTSQIMILVAYGCPVDDIATKATVSTANVKLNYVVSKNYKYHFIQDNVKNFTIVNNVTTAADSLYEGINAATGAVTTDTVA